VTDLDPVALDAHEQFPRPAGLVRAAHRVDALLDRQRLRNYSLIILVFGAVVLIAAALVAPDKVLTDYVAHWTGGRLLLDGRGGALYDGSVQLDLQRQALGQTDNFAWFVSPPFVAVLYAPLAALPIRVSGVVWTVLSAGALVASARLARPLAPAWLQESWSLVLLVAAASAPVFRLLGAGQDSALLLLIWVAGTRLLLTRREAAGGAVLALGLAKPQIVFLVPLVLLVQGRWRALGAFAATGIVLVALSVAAVGPVSAWTSVVLPFSDTYQRDVQLGQAWQMQGVTALATTVLPESWATSAQLVGSALAVALVLVLLVAAARHRRDGSRDAELWALIAVVTVLASPHVLDYDLVLLLPAVLISLHDRWDTVARLSLLALFVTTWTTPARHALGSLLPWPLNVVGAAWTALPLLVLAWSLWRCRARGNKSPSGAQP
jgi:hypothetical protein